MDWSDFGRVVVERPAVTHKCAMPKATLFPMVTVFALLDMKGTFKEWQCFSTAGNYSLLIDAKLYVSLACLLCSHVFS